MDIVTDGRRSSGASFVLMEWNRAERDWVTVGWRNADSGRAAANVLAAVAAGVVAFLLQH